MSKLTKVVNLFGGPGAGKSTLAAKIFAALKTDGINCELVREFAKDMVWEGRPVQNQLYIFAKQYKRMKDLDGKVDVIITDSPLLLSYVYAIDESKAFFDLVDAKVKEFNNFNIFIRREKTYNPAGRLQTEDEAKELDAVIEDVLTGHHKLIWNSYTEESLLKWIWQRN